MSLNFVIDESTNDEQREKMLSGQELLFSQTMVCFQLCRNGTGASQLDDDEFKLVMLILNQGMHEALYENINVDNEVKIAAFIIGISDGYKNFSNLFNFYVEDTNEALEKIDSINSESWVQELFNEGKRVWAILAEDSENSLPLSEVFENQDLLSKAKNIYS